MPIFGRYCQPPSISARTRQQHAVMRPPDDRLLPPCIRSDTRPQFNSISLIDFEFQLPVATTTMRNVTNSY